MFNQYNKLSLYLAATVGAATAWGEAYKLVDIMPWAPLNSTSVDQSVIHNGTYFLSDRVNNGVHVINLSKKQQTSIITGFRGLSTINGKNNYAISGPNGLLVLPDRNELYVGDGDGTVRVIDLFTHSIVGNISTGSTHRADEMAYDAKTGIVAVTLPNDNPPAVAIISAKDRRSTGNITFHGASGLEQPTFNPADGLFYVSVPTTSTNVGGEIAGVDASAMKITRTLALQECIPAGIVFGPNQHLFISCSQDQILKFGTAFSQVMDVASGRIIANISGIAGVDQVAYDPHANLYFATAYQNLKGGRKEGEPTPQLAVIDAEKNVLLQTLVTDNVTAHSVAVDPATDQCVVPLKQYGIALYNLTSSTGTLTATASVSSTTGTQVVNSAGCELRASVLWRAALTLVSLGVAFL